MNSSVTGKDWLPIAVHSAAVERRLKAGESVFQRGDRSTGLYEVVKGRVRLARVDRSGREAILHVAVQGDTMAEASLFSPTYHCDAIAMTDAIVHRYPKGALLTEFERNPRAARAFMAMLARQVMTQRTRLEQRNIHSAHDRIRHYLTANAAEDGRTVVLRGTLKELAGELGLTHEALYRALADMAAKGEIERLKGTIRLIGSI
jgi:CRP-like cAMP-binding protein